jgi:transposase
VSPASRDRLEVLIADRNTSSKVVWRAEIVLATADGCGTNAIMRRTGKSKPCAWRWQERYVEEGVEGLLRDKTRPPGKKPLPAAIKHKVLTKTANKAPANATHWSRASMAAEMGISPSSVGRIWADAGLKSHLVKTFKISNDPQFEETVADICRSLWAYRLVSCDGALPRARGRGLDRAPSGLAAAPCASPVPPVDEA